VPAARADPYLATGSAAPAPLGIVRSVADWNQKVIDEFRANAGRVGGTFEGRTLLLLHHRGARTGTERVNPVAYQRLSDDSVAVFASKGGAPTNPDWYYNLTVAGKGSVELGTGTFPVSVRELHGEEHDRIYAEQGSGGEIDIGERLGPRGLMAIHDELEVLPQSGFIENEVNVCPLGV